MSGEEALLAVISSVQVVPSAQQLGFQGSEGRTRLQKPTAEGKAVIVHEVWGYALHPVAFQQVLPLCLLAAASLPRSEDRLQTGRSDYDIWAHHNFNILHNKHSTSAGFLAGKASSMSEISI